MKKFGKFEKQHENVAAEQPKVKNMLLQTYFTSLLCLVLCVTMFFGTSYAWFSSEVNNAANEIYIGTLDVGLYKTQPNTTAVLDLANSDNKLFDKNIRWEPGYTNLETIQVVNEGDLAFKYVLTFTEDSAEGTQAANLDEIAKFFDVWVHDHKDGAPTPASYEDISVAKGWVNVGMLDQILAGAPVLEGLMEEKDVREAGQEEPNVGTTDGKEIVHTYTIALHMNEAASAEVMGQKISLCVKLVAYQMASEKDGMSDKYDNVTAVLNGTDLQKEMSADNDVLLAGDIEIKELDSCVTMGSGILDGNGNAIVYSGDRNASGGSVGVVNTSGGTVINLTVDGGDNGRALYLTKLTSDLTVTNCDLNGVYSFNLSSNAVSEYTMNFTNTIFRAWTSYANVMEHAYFTDCKFENVLKPYGDTTLTNCVFTADSVLDVSELKDGETITLENCTFKGMMGVNAVVKMVNGTLQLECANHVIEISNGEIVLVSNNG